MTNTTYCPFISLELKGTFYSYYSVLSCLLFNVEAFFNVAIYCLNSLFQARDSQLSLLQGSLSRLIYRYLSSGGQADDAGQRKCLLEKADEKTRLLLSLVQDIHTSAHIIKHRTRSRYQDTSVCSCNCNYLSSVS